MCAICTQFVDRSGGWVTFSLTSAGVAQLVEQLICNQQVGGSSPFASLWSVLRAGPRMTCSYGAFRGFTPRRGSVTFHSSAVKGRPICMGRLFSALGGDAWTD